MSQALRFSGTCQQTCKWSVLNFFFFCFAHPKISKCFFVVNCLGIFFFTCLFVFSQIKRIHSASRLNDDTIKIRKKKKRTSNIKFADKWKELKRAINRSFQRYVYSNFVIIMEFIFKIRKCMEQNLFLSSVRMNFCFF